jgi:3-oxoacyl-[acyl-carrier protein] reductase/pteridine reductase
MHPLQHKRALVTGGARRIGRTIALTLAQAGASVAITYRNSVAEAESTLREIANANEAAGGEAIAIRCDLRDPENIREAVSEVVSDLGGLDYLINNAGAFESAALESITPQQWDALFEINTRAPLLMAQAAHPHLKSAHGRIVNIGSLGGLKPWATHGHYSSSKAALHMLSQTMAKAWAPEISVNCVAPGMVVIGEVDQAYRHFAEKTPMRANATPDDVAAAVMFFLTGPHFITGQLLAVDGGLGL